MGAQPADVPVCESQVTVIECHEPGAKWRRVADPDAAGAFALISELTHQPLDLYGGADPGRRNIDLQTCASPEFKANNLWALSAAGLLRSADTKGCVHTGNISVTTPNALGSQNVWARQLAGGRVAIFFFNVGVSSASISCGTACLAAVGLAPSSSNSYGVRDLIAHKNLADLAMPDLVAKDVPGNGGSVTLLITPPPRATQWKSDDNTSPAASRLEAPPGSENWHGALQPQHLSSLSLYLLWKA